MILAGILALLIVLCITISAAFDKDAEPEYIASESKMVALGTPITVAVGTKAPTPATLLTVKPSEAEQLVSDYVRPEAVETLIEAVEESMAEAEEPEIVVVPLYTEQDVKVMAKMLYGECRGVPSVMQQAGCGWVVCNRYDSGDPFYRKCDSISDIITQYYGTDDQQFHGYRESNPVTEELEALARDILDRWSAEKAGVEDVGRVLPKEFLYFHARDKRNIFTDDWRGGSEWDWSLPNPYEN